MRIINLGILVFGILLVRKVAWGYISRRFQYSLWICVAFFLFMNPLFSISSKFSIENIIYRVGKLAEKTEENSLSIDESTFTNNYVSVDADQGEIISEQDGYHVVFDTEKKEVNVKQVQDTSSDMEVVTDQLEENYWKYIRWGVTITIAVFLFVSNIFFYISCRRNRIFYKRDKETKLNVFLLEGIHSPFLLGNIIYVDVNMTANPKSLRHMIIHEYCHYKHWDNLWMMVRNVCFALNWYNPFVWIAMEFMKRDCELACDEAALEILDRDERKEYGYTLLSIAKGQKAKNGYLSVATTMNGRIKKLKERIIMISSERKSNMGITCMVVFGVILLTGCTFTHKEELKIEDDEVKESTMLDMSEQTEQKKSNVEDAKSSWDNDTSNIVYNSVKYCDGYFYYSDSDGFKRIDKELITIETLADGNVKLGNCDKEFIYYVRYPTSDKENAGVLRMNLTNLQEEKLVEWSEAMWSCSNVYECENIVYLEGNNICKAYEIKEGEVKEIEEKDNRIYHQLDKCGISYTDINALASGYTNASFNYRKLVYLDRDDKKLVVYDTDSGEIINTIENCGSDILVNERGIVYKDLDNNILFIEWENGNPKLLYDMADNNYNFVNYGTFDDQYIYGFYEDEGKSTLIKISWEGEIEKGTVFENVETAVGLGFSANNGIISFWQDGHIIFEKE